MKLHIEIANINSQQKANRYYKANIQLSLMTVSQFKRARKTFVTKVKI